MNNNNNYNDNEIYNYFQETILLYNLLTMINNDNNIFNNMYWKP